MTKLFIIICLLAAANCAFCEALKMPDGGPELKPGLSTVNTPIVHQSYFQQEREIFGYNPHYTPNPVAFGPDDNYYIKAPGWIETTDYNDSLLKIDFTKFIKEDFPTWDGTFAVCGENRLAIDNFGYAYMIIHPTGKGYCLMYSQDFCRSWRLYELSTSIVDVRMECPDGGSVKTGMMGLLVRYTQGSTNSLGFIALSKTSAGNLTLSSIKQVTTNGIIGSGFKTGSNSFATYGTKSHIVFSGSVPNGSGTPQYAVTYDHSAGTMGTAVYLGNAGVGDPNENSWPCICVDKDGFLHVLLNPFTGSSGNFCKYIRSSQSNSTTGGWTTAENLPNGLVRAAMVCDSNNTLHVAAADVFYSQKSLKYTYKQSGQSWSAAAVLVTPWNDVPAQPAPDAFYNQSLSIDKHNRLALSYSVRRNLTNTAQQIAYQAYNPCEAGNSDSAVLVKQGETSPWQLATSDKLIYPNVFPNVDTVLTDSAFFNGALNLNYAGLEAVKAAVQNSNIPLAKTELAKYYRSRQGTYWWFSPHQINPSLGNSSDLSFAYDVLNHTGDWALESLWLPNGEPNWPTNSSYNSESWSRMYFMTNLGRAYWYSGREYPAVTAYLLLLRSWIKQVPQAANPGYWTQMRTGIRMRSGWGDAFNYFLHSPLYTDSDLILQLKSVVEQARFIRANAVANPPNHMTFALAGLYGAGVLFPEMAEAADWRSYACTTAINDMDESFLPDGSEIELSSQYGQYFSRNYLTAMHDLALLTGRFTESGLEQIVPKCEQPFEFYQKIMTPDRYTPAYNDSPAPDVKTFMAAASSRFPSRQDFQWIATEGVEGTPPAYTSCFLPYGGYASMRSGWSRTDNYLGFDMGPPGDSHVHQDKLNVVMWSYGRMIIFDPLRGDYNDIPISIWAADTFAHNTVLVDNRPQRRYWVEPSVGLMPYQPLTDVYWESDSSHDFARGVYDSNYSGIQGASDSYPYKPGGNFGYGWVRPATHYRRVYFKKPDIFVVCDTLVDKVSSSHTYDVRWQINSTNTAVRNSNWVRTTDSGLPNVEIIPLITSGLTISSTSGQTSPEILGWSGTDWIAKTTLQHKKTGSGTVQFLTLLMPMPDTNTIVQSVTVVNSTTWDVALTDGRVYRISYSTSPTGTITVELLP